ncbi:hypothetical protein ACRC7T_18700 (plasmid) [Segnochrobactraceae bacterium EtOH-i3]
MTEDDRARRLAAKRNNERVKLAASTMNAIGLTTFGAAFILPFVNGGPATPTPLWVIVAAVLHVGAHVLFRFLRSED